MYKLEFQLTQHTPIIHFQSGYEGATLRASEVKPKLDRYLLKKLKKDELNPDWFISQERGALDYKLSFELMDNVDVVRYLPLSNIGANDRGILQTYLDEPLEDSKIDRLLKGSKILSPTPFFANAEYASNRVKREKGKNEKEKNRRSKNDKGNDVKGQVRLALLARPSMPRDASIRGLILCKDASLREKISQYICDFFLQHNFGMRQTKGFGSFSIEDKNPISKVNQLYKGLYFETQVSSQDQLFENINLFYKSLRSGLNECRGGGQSVLYMKPMIFYYAAGKGQKTWWDKRSIKHAFASAMLRKHDEVHNYHEANQNAKLDYRDMFGLSTNENWGKHYDNMEIKKTCISNEKTINRMKSPIQFKPIFISEYNSKQTYRIYIGIIEEEVGLSELIAQETVVKVKAIRNYQELIPQCATDSIDEASSNTSSHDNSLPLTFPKINSIVDVINFQSYKDKLQKELTCKREGERIRNLLLGIYKQLAKHEQEWKDTIKKEKSTPLLR